MFKKLLVLSMALAFVLSACQVGSYEAPITRDGTPVGKVSLEIFDETTETVTPTVPAAQAEVTPSATPTLPAVTETPMPTEEVVQGILYVYGYGVESIAYKQAIAACQTCTIVMITNWDQVPEGKYYSFNAQSKTGENLADGARTKTDLMEMKLVIFNNFTPTE